MSLSLDDLANPLVTSVHLQSGIPNDGELLTTQQAFPKSAILTLIFSALTGSRGLTSRDPAVNLSTTEQEGKHKGKRLFVFLLKINNSVLTCRTQTQRSCRCVNA